MKSDEASKKASLRPLVKFNKAFKLAEQWVNSMSQLEDEKFAKVEVRPSRLGVGAAVARESKVVQSNDPIERRLRAKLESHKKKVVKNAEEPGGPTLNGNSQEDSDDEELGSKTKAFVKKRPADWTLSLQQGKKKLK
ncbi:uncharacterized protein LOC113761935 [Coffea eugenioides]|uniref:RRP15-like protein n=1 Tax=Coffea arabica TaxID=13443 RepID=A0A6P6WIF5_COFAR|nr:uncharacterized protein LOC113733187 [Coffea arabica]XP_027160930.1 uncharacterized protein LOC113761935 [Coffea eugenioides]